MERFLAAAARVARRQGLGGLTFTWSDLGDFLHVHGRRGTATRFVAMLKHRAEARPASAC